MGARPNSREADSQLRLSAIEPWPLQIPLRHPMRLASETINNAETLLVRVVDSTGLEGWGEASIAPTMTGELMPGMLAAVQGFLAPALLAQPVPDPAAGARRLERAIRGNTGAKAAVEMALLDLFARRSGLPLASLLGQPRRDRAPAIRMVGDGNPEATLNGVAAARAAGFSHIKVKLGIAPKPEDDASLARQARKLAGPGAHLAGDANMAWTRAAALAFLHGMGPDVLDYLEQPVADDDIAGMAECVAAQICPICFDEGLHGAADIATHAARRAADGVGLKAIKLGGLQAALAADTLARRHGLRPTHACKIAETSIGAAALAQLAAVLPEVGWGVSVTHEYLAEDVVTEPLPVRQGMLTIPSAPGIGLVPEPAALRRLRWSAG